MRHFDPDKTVLVVDIGNTNTNCALYEDSTQLTKLIMPDTLADTGSTLIRLLQEGLPDYSLEPLKYLAMASVVPALKPLWRELCTTLNIKLYDIGPHSPLGLRYPYPDPSYIGADLVINAYAAWKRYSANCIIIDLGTATTIQLVNSDGFYEAAAILPGLKTGAQNLTARTAQLPPLELERPTRLLGTDTKEALLCGIVGGHAMMLEAFIDRLRREYPAKAPLKSIITGGLSELLAPMIPNLDVHDPDLTLDGLQMAFAHLRAQES